MGAPYSPDLRERVIAAVDGGLGAYASAAVFRVSVSYIYKALGRRRATGETTARASGRGPAQKLAPFDAALRARVAEEPDITLVELQNWFLAQHATKVSVGCLWKQLRRLVPRDTQDESPASIRMRIAGVLARRREGEARP